MSVILNEEKQAILLGIYDPSIPACTDAEEILSMDVCEHNGVELQEMDFLHQKVYLLEKLLMKEKRDRLFDREVLYYVSQRVKEKYERHIMTQERLILKGEIALNLPKKRRSKKILNDIKEGYKPTLLYREGLAEKYELPIYSTVIYPSISDIPEPEPIFLK